jgi:hypothetical protein
LEHVQDRFSRRPPGLSGIVETHPRTGVGISEDVRPAVMGGVGKLVADLLELVLDLVGSRDGRGDS